VGVLIQARQGRGDDVVRLAGARDDRGEDRLLLINGRRVVVQFVSVPADQSVWKELSIGGTSRTSGSSEQAVQLIREALTHKKCKAADTLLVLDAAHLGAIVCPSLVESYHEAHGDPETEFALFEAWIVGPTVRSTLRLGKSHRQEVTAAGKAMRLER